MKRLVAIALLIFGCDNHSVPPGGVANNKITVFTDKSDYMRNEKTVITISNNTDQVVIFHGCSSNVFYYRDQWIEGQWLEWTRLACSDSLMDEMAIEPYENLLDSIVVHKPGTYRFRYPLFLQGDGNAPDTLTSNAFTIH